MVLPVKVRVAGMDMDAAEAALSAKLSAVARLKLDAWLTPTIVAGRPDDEGDVGALSQRGQREAREAALAWFRNYILPVKEPAEAVVRYWDWVTKHRDAPEIFTMEPPEVWSLALSPPKASSWILQQEQR